MDTLVSADRTALIDHANQFPGAVEPAIRAVGVRLLGAVHERVDMPFRHDPDADLRLAVLRHGDGVAPHAGLGLGPLLGRDGTIV